MADVLNPVRAHYNATGLTQRLQDALAAFGPGSELLTPQQLGAVDQFHTRGLAATVDLSGLAGINAETVVLDVGSGIGGPARYLASATGCHVVGVDLSEPFVEAARYLTERTGQTDRVSFKVASALELPFPDEAFEVVVLQHVAMNIEDRAGLYRELRRALKPGGRLAVYDIVSTRDEPTYPLPWARTPATSFLLTGSETRSTIESHGFITTTWRDDTELAKAWSASLRTSGPPPGPNLGLVMGPGFPELATNLAKDLMQGRLGVVTAIFEAI